MNKQNSSDGNPTSELKSKVRKLYISAEELAELGVSGIPRSRQGVRDRARRDKWEERQVPGKGGPGGQRTEYAPPDELLPLVIDRLLVKGFDKYCQTVATGEPRASAVHQFVADYNVHSSAVDYIEGVEQISHEMVEEALSKKAKPPASAKPLAWPDSASREIHQVGAEWLVGLAIYATEAQWLRPVPYERKVAIIIEAYRAVLLFAGGDQERLRALTDKPDAFLSALRLAYEMDCSRRGIAPGIDAG